MMVPKRAETEASSPDGPNVGTVPIDRALCVNLYPRPASTPITVESISLSMPAKLRSVRSVSGLVGGAEGKGTSAP